MDYGCKLFLILHDFNRKRESLIAVENVSFVPFCVIMRKFCAEDTQPRMVYDPTVPARSATTRLNERERKRQTA